MRPLVSAVPAGLGDKSWRKASGIVLVLLLHVLALRALLDSTLPRREAAVPPALEVSILEPPKPPEVIKAPEPPKLVQAPKPQVKRLVPPPTLPKTEPTPGTSSEGLAPVKQEVRPELTPAPAAPPAPAVRIAAQVDATSECEAPRYPPGSRSAGEIGTVRLLFLISPQGQVEQARIEKSSGFDRLDDAARDALSLCHFKPGTVDGRPERSWARLDYVWRLK